MECHLLKIFFLPGMCTCTYVNGTLTADWPIDLRNSLQILMLEFPFHLCFHINLACSFIICLLSIYINPTKL